MVDLDELEKLLKNAPLRPINDAGIPALIAELRGLREVYDALRSYQTTPGNIDERWDEVETAVAAVMKRGV